MRRRMRRRSRDPAFRKPSTMPTRGRGSGIGCGGNALPTAASYRLSISRTRSSRATGLWASGIHRTVDVRDFARRPRTLGRAGRAPSALSGSTASKLTERPLLVVAMLTAEISLQGSKGTCPSGAATSSSEITKVARFWNQAWLASATPASRTPIAPMNTLSGHPPSPRRENAIRLRPPSPAATLTPFGTRTVLPTISLPMTALPTLTVDDSTPPLTSIERPAIWLERRAGEEASEPSLMLSKQAEQQRASPSDTVLALTDIPSAHPLTKTCVSTVIFFALHTVTSPTAPSFRRACPISTSTSGAHQPGWGHGTPRPQLRSVLLGGGEPGLPIRRTVHRRGPDHRDLLPAKLPGADYAPAGERAVLRLRRRSAARRVPGLQALPPRRDPRLPGVGLPGGPGWAGDAAHRRRGRRPGRGDGARPAAGHQRAASAPDPRRGRRGAATRPGTGPAGADGPGAG